MNGNKIVTVLDNIFQWITRLALVNGLWILFSTLGLLILGIFPATAAALGVSRKWILGQHDIKTIQTFKTFFFQEFIRANLLGFLLTFGGFVIYINYQVIINMNINNELLFVFPFVFLLLVLFYILTIIWSFPLLVHYHGSSINHIKNALIIGLTKIHYSIAIVVVILLISYLSIRFPGMIVFFSISTIAFCSMWLSMKVFKKIDERPN